MATEGEHEAPGYSHADFINTLAARLCPEIDQWSDADKQALDDFTALDGAQAKLEAFIAEGAFNDLTGKMCGIAMKDYHMLRLLSAKWQAIIADVQNQMAAEESQSSGEKRKATDTGESDEPCPCAGGMPGERWP